MWAPPPPDTQLSPPQPPLLPGVLHRGAHLGASAVVFCEARYVLHFVAEFVLVFLVLVGEWY